MSAGARGPKGSGGSVEGPGRKFLRSVCGSMEKKTYLCRATQGFNRETMKKLAFLLTLMGLTTAHAQHNIDFDDDWTFQRQGTTHRVRLPRAWNEDDAFRVNNAELPTDTVRYVKRFRLPRTARGKRVFVEFEIAYSMQSFRLITFEDSWAQELSTGPRVITKYTQIKAIKRVFLLITIALLHFRHKASTFTVPFGLNKR